MRKLNLLFYLKSGFLSLCDEDTEYQMRELLQNYLRKSGFNKYEISNFAKAGFEAIHNTNYWKQEEYIGFGVHSSSYILGTRYKNIDNIEKYIENITNGNDISCEKVHLDKLDLMKEYVMLNLRLSSGVNINSFYNKFSTSIYDVFGVEIKKLVDLELITDDKLNNTIYLTKHGAEVANIVFQEFV